MPVVKKLFGENPENIHVLDTVAEFDENGEAEVSEEAAEVFGQIPGYEVIGEEAPSEEEVPEDEDTSEDEEAPKPKARPARKSPLKK